MHAWTLQIRRQLDHMIDAQDFGVEPNSLWDIDRRTRMRLIVSLHIGRAKASQLIN